MLKHIHTHRTRYAAASVLLGVVFVVLGVITRDPAVEHVYESMTHTYVLAHASSVPLTIEGVYVPRNDAVIAANRSGRLSEVRVTEGDVVERGDVLAVVDARVMRAERVALVAQITRQQRERAMQEIVAAGSVGVAEKSLAGSTETARTARDTAVSGLAEARAGLLASVEAGYLSATEALDFLADTSPLNNSEVRALRLAAVETVAGSAGGTYLGGALRTGGDQDGLIDLLKRAQAAPAVTDDELDALAEVALYGLTQTQNAYLAAEREVYKRGSMVTDLERSTYNQNRAAVRSAESAVANAVHGLALARDALEEAQAAEESVVAVQAAQVENAHAVYQEEQYVSAAQLTELEARLRALDVALEETVVRAPYSGTVERVAVEPGGFVQVGTPIVSLQSVSGMELEALVAPQHMHGVAPGVPVRLVSGVTGVVDRVEPRVDVSHGGVRVYIALDRVPSDLVVGTRARGVLDVPCAGTDACKVFVVPHAAVAYDFSGPVVAAGEGTVSVEIVRDTRESVYLTGDELTVGTVIELR